MQVVLPRSSISLGRISEGAKVRYIEMMFCMTHLHLHITVLHCVLVFNFFHVVIDKTQGHMREEQLLQMLKQEKEDLDARLYAYKRRRLNELSERIIVRVKEDLAVAVVERLLEETIIANVDERELYSSPLI